MRMPEIDVRTKELNHVSMAGKPTGVCLWIGLDPGTAGVALRFSLTFDSPRQIRDSRSAGLRMM